MLKNVWFAFLIAALVFFAAVVGMNLTRPSSQPPSDKQIANQAKAKESTNETPNNQDNIISWQQLWWRTLNDPVAFFTGVLAVFSGGLLAVACLQIWLLLRAESVSTKAAQAAQSSAEAASDSVRAFIDSERGRMFISEIKLNKKDANDPQPTIDYSFVNVGRSAVVLIRGSIECDPIGSELSSIIITFDPIKEFGADIAVVAGSLIGANTKPSLPQCPAFRTPLTADDYTNIAAKKAYILVKGFLRYRTGFDDIYRLNFASVYGARGDSFGGLTIPGSNEEYHEPTTK